MKKFLLPVALLAAAFSPAAAVDVTFGYCSESVNGLGMPQANYYLSTAIEIPVEIQDLYPDGKLEAVSIGLGTGRANSGTLYLTYELGGTPFYKQDFADLSLNSFNEIILDEAYVLQNKPFYVGYYIKTSASTDYPIGFDCVDHALPQGSYIAVGLDLESMNKAWEVMDPAQGFGNASLKCTFSTSAESVRALMPMAASMPAFTTPGEEVDYVVAYKNIGSEPLTIKGFALTANGEPLEFKSEICETLAPFAEGESVLTFAISELADEIPVVVSIAEVEGETGNDLASTELTEASADIEVSDQGYIKTTVIEEGTGTTCPWCIRGYVAMESMMEKYKKNYIGITVHTYSPSDKMYCNDYAVAARTIFGGGYPSANANREGVFDPSFANCEAKYRAIRGQKALQGIAITEVLYTDPAYSNLAVKCDVSTFEEMPAGQYGIALVTTENEVGPFSQSNGYAGGSKGPMGGFESKPSVVSLVFNEVARNVYNWNGGIAIPDAVEANTTASLDPLYVSTAKIGDFANAHVVALLINKKTGRIVNADRVALPEAVAENVDPSGVAGIAADSEEALYFTVDGLAVDADALTPGLYIRLQNGRSEKVVIR